MRYAQRGGLELREGPLAHGFVSDQRWTLGRIKTLIGRLFHVGYTVEGTWKLMRRHGWSCQVPVRQAMERDDEAVAVWKAEGGRWCGTGITSTSTSRRPNLIDGCLAATGLTIEPWRAT